MQEKTTKYFKNPSFSVVIPVYNKGPHIHRSISSVLNQTYKNFELILINDSSTDNSLEECRKFSDERIQIFQRDKPGPGGYAARNLGIEKAKGEWIAFLDADDEWMPNHLEKLFELSQKFPHVFFMVSGWQFKENGIIADQAYYLMNHQNGTHIITLKRYLETALKRIGPIWTSVVCVKKSSPVVKNLFPAELGVKRGGDLHAWLKMICYHKEVAWSDHIGAIYYQDSVSMVTKNANHSTTLMSKPIYKYLSDNLNNQEKNLLKKYSNLRLKNTLIASSIKKQKDLEYIKHIHWLGDFFNAIIIFLFTLLPIRFLYNLKKLIK